MSLRALWVVLYSRDDSIKILYSRCFPTIEKKCQLIEGSSYVGVPPNTGFSDGLRQVMRAGSSSKSKHKQQLLDQKPVFEFPVPTGVLWPFVIIEQHGLLYCCLPLVEDGSHTRPPLIKLCGLSAGFTLLLGMGELLGKLPSNTTDISLKFSELHQYVSECAPFGSPVDASVINASAHVQPKNTPPATWTQKQPAWMPVKYRGKSSLSIIISEKVRASQHDREGVEDVLYVHGTITCRGAFEGHMTDVGLTLVLPRDQATTPLQHVLYHPFVQNVEVQDDFLQDDNGGHGGGYARLRMTPPPDNFSLCFYTCTQLQHAPIQGFYQMKGEKQIELLVQLKLNKSVRNSFEYCEVKLPFFNRGQIVTHECTPNHGSVRISQGRTSLVWNIGSRFPQKSLEVQMKAALTFKHYDPNHAKTAEELFCHGPNTYAQIFFKVSDYTHTGLQLDGKSVQISPSQKFRLNSVRELVTTDYKIWNSHGDVPASFTPPDDLLESLHQANHHVT